ncbi:MAG: hypothetical protein IT427_05415 [Pirellulales bacterium]|nr:hypothetical protein [Pirellulales bacterium]
MNAAKTYTALGKYARFRYLHFHHKNYFPKSHDDTKRKFPENHQWLNNVRRFCRSSFIIHRRAPQGFRPRTGHVRESRRVLVTKPKQPPAA